MNQDLRLVEFELSTRKHSACVCVGTARVKFVDNPYSDLVDTGYLIRWSVLSDSKLVLSAGRATSEKLGSSMQRAEKLIRDEFRAVIDRLFLASMQAGNGESDVTSD